MLCKCAPSPAKTQSGIVNLLGTSCLIFISLVKCLVKIRYFEEVRMNEQVKDYEKNVSQYPLDPEREADLIKLQSECTFMWTNKEGHPMGVIMSYLEYEGKLWLTAAPNKARIAAIKRDGRSAICITSTGTSMFGGKTVSYKGHCLIHENNQDIKDWFYAALSERLYGESAEKLYQDTSQTKKDQFVEFLDTPGRVIFEFKIEKTIGFDGDKIGVDTSDSNADEE